MKRNSFLFIFSRVPLFSAMIALAVSVIFPQEALTSGPNSVTVDKEWYRISIASMVYKHWSESDPHKLQQIINEQNEEFRRKHAPLIKEAEAGIERCFSDWRKRHPELKIEKWSLAKDFPQFDEMMAEEGGFPSNESFVLSMGFRLSAQTMTAGVEIGFSNTLTKTAYQELKRSLTALFKELDRKSWPEPEMVFPPSRGPRPPNKKER